MAKPFDGTTERLSDLAKRLMVVAAIMFIGYSSYIVDNTEQVIGTITGMVAWETREGSTVNTTATLEDDSKVRVYMPAYPGIEKGKKDVLIATKAKCFGGRRYSFKEYVDE